MASSVAELIAVLSEKESAMEDLALILTEEQRCIVGLDTDSLARNDLRKEDVLARLARLKGSCADLMGGQSLSALVETATGADRELLAPLQRRLAGCAAGLQRQLATNRTMLEHSLGMIRESMALFGTLLGGCATYGAGGTIRSGGPGGLLLRREI